MSWNSTGPVCLVPSSWHPREDPQVGRVVQEYSTSDWSAWRGSRHARQARLVGHARMPATSRTCRRECHEDATRKLLSWNLGYITHGCRASWSLHVTVPLFRVLYGILSIVQFKALAKNFINQISIHVSFSPCLLYLLVLIYVGLLHVE